MLVLLVAVEIEARPVKRAQDIWGHPQFPLRTFGATHNFLWLLDKRLRIRYV
jgi:hypothetical protein